MLEYFWFQELRRALLPSIKSKNNPAITLLCRSFPLVGELKEFWCCCRSRPGKYLQHVSDLPHKGKAVPKVLFCGVSHVASILQVLLQDPAKISLPQVTKKRTVIPCGTLTAAQHDSSITRVVSENLMVTNLSSQAF